MITAAHFHLSELFPALFQAGADAAIKSFVLFSAGAAAVLMLRRLSAATRHLLLFSVIVSAFALPVLSLVLPRWTVLSLNSLAPALSISAAESKQISIFVGPYRVNTFELFPPATDLKPSGARAPLARKLQTSEILALVWIGGATLSLAPVFLGLFSLISLTLNSIPISSGRAHRVLSETASAIGYRRPIRLLKFNRRTMPLT